MKKTQNIMVAGLVVLALILAALLVITPAQPRSAYGDTMASLGDFTLMASGHNPGSEEQIITIIDNRSQRMICYELTNNQFRVIGGNDLAKSFK